ncbi:MAG: NADH-quinone oxidoreductase subunit H, partial [bacterium]
GVAWGGWAGGSKYSLMGGLRASAQMISYELSLGLTFLSIVMINETLSLVEIVEFQMTHGWNVIYQPVAMCLFIVSMFAETNRLPFDLPEAETELVGGYHTEYSSMRFGLFFLGEYLHMIAVSSLCTVLFLGGWLPPFPEWAGWTSLAHGMNNSIGAIPWVGSYILSVLFVLTPLAIFMTKVFAFMFLFVWVRGTFPRFRYDQLMKIGWKVLLELAFVNLFIAAFMRASWPEPTWSWIILQGLLAIIFFWITWNVELGSKSDNTVTLED